MVTVHGNSIEFHRQPKAKIIDIYIYMLIVRIRVQSSKIKSLKKISTLSKQISVIIYSANESRILAV